MPVGAAGGFLRLKCEDCLFVWETTINWDTIGVSMMGIFCPECGFLNRPITAYKLANPDEFKEKL